MGGDHRSAAIEAQADTILSLLAEQPDATLVEYQAPGFWSEAQRG